MLLVSKVLNSKLENSVHSNKANGASTRAQANK